MTAIINQVVCSSMLNILIWENSPLLLTLMSYIDIYRKSLPLAKPENSLTFPKMHQENFLQRFWIKTFIPEIKSEQKDQKKYILPNV